MLPLFSFHVLRYVPAPYPRCVTYRRMTKTFIILGAGMTGLPLAHYVLKHYADKYDLKLLLISRSSEFYWNIGSPRAAIPGQLGDDKILYSIPPAFAQYPTYRFEFIHGTVDSWDPDKNNVSVTQNNGHQRKLDYHTIVVATGSDYSDGMPWKLVGDHQKTHDALTKLRNEVHSANSIVVGGGGPTGVEFAGELGYQYAKEGKKKVTLVISESLPLESRVMQETRVAAKKELEKLNVTIITNARVTTSETRGTGRKVLELTSIDGTKTALETDLFVPTWGVKFNTSFAPVFLLDANGRLKVTKSLRAPGYDNAFLVGDAANLDSYSARVREAQVRHLATALGQYLYGAKVLDYTPAEKVTLLVTVGRGRGVGQLNGWKLWSFLVWYYKGRNMCTNLVPDYLAGKRLVLGAF